MANVSFKRRINANYTDSSGIGGENTDGKIYFAKDGIFLGTGTGTNNAYPVAPSRSYVEELMKGIGSEILAGALTFNTSGTLAFTSLNAKLFTQSEQQAISSITEFYNLSKAASLKAGYSFRVVNAGTIKVKSGTVEPITDVTIALEAGDIIIFTNNIAQSSSSVINKSQIIAVQGNVTIFDGGAAGLVPTAPTEGKAGKFLAGDGSWKVIETEIPVTDVKVNDLSALSDDGVANINFIGAFKAEATAGSKVDVSLDLGDGIKINDDDALTINSGNGLLISSGGTLDAAIDDNTLGFDDDKQIKVADDAALSNGQLATASFNVKGGVKVGGDGLSMDGERIIIAPDNDTIGFDDGMLCVKNDAGLSNGQLATASSTVKGGVKINYGGLTINDGVLAVVPGSGLILQNAGTQIGINADGNQFAFNSSMLSLSTAITTKLACLEWE